MLRIEDFEIVSSRKHAKIVAIPSDDLQNIREDMIREFHKSLKFCLKKDNPHAGGNYSDEVFWGMKTTMTKLGYDFTYRGERVVTASDVAKEILKELDELSKENKQLIS